MDAGMDVARLNFSHGDHETHREVFNRIRRQSQKRNKAISILLDLQGPKIRVGKIKGGQLTLSPGEELTITTEPIEGENGRVPTSYQSLPQDVKTGDTILLDDGYLKLEVISTTKTDVVTKVIDGGVLKNNKGINLPGVSVSAPALTEKDRKDLQFGLSLGVEYIALSFVRSPADLREAKKLATSGDFRIPVIAKIEKPEAIEQLGEIIAAADGIMVARGDLGVELGPEKVPLLQKEIIARTNAQGKIVITATQMLESMIQNPRPTRAEASDVANAVMDGTDAVMLSGETAVGQYPMECVRTMSRIIQEIETSESFVHTEEGNIVDLPVSANAIAHGTVSAARAMGLKTIVAVTESGGSARLLSEYRPTSKIIALTVNEMTYRRLALHWGVTPVFIEPASSTDEMLDRVEQTLLKNNLAAPGETIAIAMAIPVGAGLSTNLLKVHTLPD